MKISSDKNAQPVTRTIEHVGQTDTVSQTEAAFNLIAQMLGLDSRFDSANQTKNNENTIVEDSSHQEETVTADLVQDALAIEFNEIIHPEVLLNDHINQTHLNNENMLHSLSDEILAGTDQAIVTVKEKLLGSSADNIKQLDDNMLISANQTGDNINLNKNKQIPVESINEMLASKKNLSNQIPALNADDQRDLDTFTNQDDWLNQIKTSENDKTQSVEIQSQHTKSSDIVIPALENQDLQASNILSKWGFEHKSILNNAQDMNRTNDALILNQMTASTNLPHAADHKLTAPELTNFNASNQLASAPSTSSNTAPAPAYQFTVELPDDAQLSLKSGANADFHINLKIYPPDLGKIIAKITVKNQSNELIIITQSEHDKKIVEAHVNQLKDQFNQMNMSLDQVHVQTSTQNDQSRQDNRTAQPDENNNNMKNQTVNKKLENEHKTRSDALIDTYV